MLGSKTDPTIWVQLNCLWVNAAYPFPDPPLATLVRRGVALYPNLVVTSWAPQAHAQFAREWATLEPVTSAVFVSEYLRKVLSVNNQEEDLVVEFQQM